jgi:hypothetical protein
MDISVIIVNYNTKEATSECIESCLDEGSGYKIEVIVVDNGSSDGSIEYLKRLYGDKGAKVIIKANKNNEGFSKGVNVGLGNSKGKYKYLLNSDTKVEKGVFKKLVAYASSHQDVGVLGTKLILPDGTVQKSCFNFPSVKNAFEEFWIGKEKKYSSFFSRETAGVDAVVGASFFITPGCFEKVGLFDERYFMYFEDLDYCRRVKKAGFNVVYFPEATVFHYHGLSGKDIVGGSNQWRRLFPSSKIFNGFLKHYLLNVVIWSGQKARSIMSKI